MNSAKDKIMSHLKTNANKNNSKITPANNVYGGAKKNKDKKKLSKPKITNQKTIKL